MKNVLILALLVGILFINVSTANALAQSDEGGLDTSALDLLEEETNSNSVADLPDQTTDSSATANVVSEATKDSEASATTKTSQNSIWSLLAASGWVGVVIFLLSLTACSLVIQFILTLRKSVLVPDELARDVARLTEQGRLRSAYDLVVADSSVLGRVLVRGFKEIDGSWNDIEKSLEDSIAEETAKQYRQVEYLSVIGNIAPMLGLLGTVLGMVVAFGDLAASDGLAKNLAQGIYFALMTTVEGLLVAIPSLAAFAYFNNRVAALSSELTNRVEAIFRPIKKRLFSNTARPETADSEASVSPRAVGSSRSSDSVSSTVRPENVPPGSKRSATATSFSSDAQTTQISAGETPVRIRGLEELPPDDFEPKKPSLKPQRRGD